MRAIGVDLHKDLIVACFLEEDGSQQTARFRPSTDGLRAFRARLRPDDRLAVEAGRNVWFFVARVADAVGEAVVVDPRRFAPIAESKKKTDERDALELARALRAGYLPTVPIPDERIIRLRQLFAARDTLVKTATQYKNLAHAALARNGVLSRRADLASARGRERLARVEGLPPSDRAVLALALRQLEAVERELIDLERLIIGLGRDLPGLRRLLQIRGLGLVAAIGILAEIGDVAWFASARKLAAYAGLVASVRQSNRTEHRGRITKQGRRRLRTLLIQAVLVLITGQRRNPLAEFYRLKKQEKGSGKALCATARKLLGVIYVLLTKDLDYWFLEERLYQKQLRALAAA